MTLHLTFTFLFHHLSMTKKWNNKSFLKFSLEWISTFILLKFFSFYSLRNMKFCFLIVNCALNFQRLLSPFSFSVLWHDLMNATFVWRVYMLRHFKWWNVSKRSINEKFLSWSKDETIWCEVKSSDTLVWSEYHISIIHHHDYHE